MSTLVHLGIAYILAAGAALFFVVCLCVIARQADDDAEECRERERREALKRISGGPGSGWRGR